MVSENKACSRDNWLNKGANKIKNAAKKIFGREAGAESGGATGTQTLNNKFSNGLVQYMPK